MLENFLIIDTETTVKTKEVDAQTVFDIGWTISNREGKIFKVRSYVVQQLHYIAVVKKKGFLIDSGQVKQETYTRKISDLYMKQLEWSSIIGQLKRDIKKYNVEFIGAYNLGFDKRVIEKTHFFFTGKDLDLFDKYFLIDLYPACAYTILNNDNYKEFAKKHNLVTSVGNYMTGAEPCYKYLFDDLEYIEEHTAATDSIDETKILHKVLSLPQLIPLQAFNINGQAWRIVNRQDKNKAD